MLLIARLLHIVLGAFWVGALIFNAAFLFPAMRDAGPDAAKVGAGLMRRRLFDVLPLVALLTLLSGVWLLWWVSGGFQPEYMRSRPAMVYSLGALAGIVAFALGIGIMRPAMLRAAALSQAAASLSGGERDAQLGKAQALRMRAGVTGRFVAALLTVSIGLMAIGRYV